MLSMTAPSKGPLEGIRVLELGHIVAGPTASLILAELGADVIKIERPGAGDQARLSKGNQGHFISYNSNKRSAALDIQAEDGRAAFLALIERSDVLIAIVDGSAQANITVTELAKSLPYSWVEQKRRIGFPDE